MSFRTKINFQDNRQHHLPTRESNDLSGTTVFGVPFSALTAGPDPNNYDTTGSVLNVVSTFSGNTGTTVFSFGHPDMWVAQDVFSAITTTTSAITQDSGNIFVGNTYQTVDGNLAYLDYTGTSFEFEVTAITETSPGIFTGSGVSSEVFWLSAGTLDFTGRTIWSDVRGISRTKSLIISDGAQANYIWTSLNSDGDGYWGPSSGVTSGITTFWEETATGNRALKDNKGGHYIVDASQYSMTAGGTGSTIIASVAGFMGGGLQNIIQSSSNYSSIIGGTGNTLTSASKSSIIGGDANVMSGSGTTNKSSIIGGTLNIMDSTGGFQLRNIIAGGSGNTMGGRVNDSAIIGGQTNNITDFLSIIVGGDNNTITSDRSFIAGGSNNTASGATSGIIGGGNNTTGANNSFIGGGQGNTINSTSTYSSIIGGYGNNLLSISTGSFIGGGYANTINDSSGGGYLSIIGGYNNTAIGSYSVIIGGSFNTVTGTRSVIIGGTGISGTTDDTVYIPNLYLINEDWTVELMDAQTVDFYAPYDLVIESVDTILSATTIALFDDGASYTTGNTITSGSKITVSAASATVINLNTVR